MNIGGPFTERMAKMRSNHIFFFANFGISNLRYASSDGGPRALEASEPLGLPSLVSLVGNPPLVGGSPNKAMKKERN